MLEIGNGGMSDPEYRTHMSLWAILAAPLLAGNDLREMKASTLEILTNHEVIAVNQDRLGKQGSRVSREGDVEVWTRPLERGAQAVALFNLGSETAKATVRWEQAGFKAAPRKARDLWSHSDLKVAAPEYSAAVPAHGVVLLRCEK
jgi:alpha-galactosidase